MTRHSTSRLVLPALAMFVVLVACEPPDGPRETPVPDLSWRNVIPPPIEPQRDVIDIPHEDDPLASTIERMQREANPDVVRGSSRRSIPIAGIASATIAGDFGIWEWSADETSTLLEYRPEGPTRALLYFEQFSELASSAPSAESRRFVASVTPALQPGPFLPAGTIGTLRGLARDQGLDPTRLVQLFERRLSPTARYGWMFTPDVATWTGWRWVGRLDEGGIARVGAVAGSWGVPPAAWAPTLVPPASPLPGPIADLLDGAEAGPRASGERAENNAAWLWLGSVSYGPSRGFHLAVLCVGELAGADGAPPSCADADVLDLVLTSLRPESVRSTASDSAPIDVHARAVGIPLVERSTVLDIVTLTRWFGTLPTLLSEGSGAP